MYCYNCGNKLMSDAKFCNQCGAKVLGVIEDENTPPILEKPTQLLTKEEAPEQDSFISVPETKPIKKQIFDWDIDKKMKSDIEKLKEKENNQAELDKKVDTIFKFNKEEEVKKEPVDPYLTQEFVPTFKKEELPKEEQEAKEAVEQIYGEQEDIVSQDNNEEVVAPEENTISEETSEAEDNTEVTDNSEEIETLEDVTKPVEGVDVDEPRIEPDDEANYHDEPTEEVDNIESETDYIPNVVLRDLSEDTEEYNDEEKILSEINNKLDNLVNNNHYNKDLYYMVEKLKYSIDDLATKIEERPYTISKEDNTTEEDEEEIDHPTPEVEDSPPPLELEPDEIDSIAQAEEYINSTIDNDLFTPINYKDNIEPENKISYNEVVDSDDKISADEKEEPDDKISNNYLEEPVNIVFENEKEESEEVIPEKPAETKNKKSKKKLNTNSKLFKVLSWLVYIILTLILLVFGFKYFAADSVVTQQLDKYIFNNFSNEEPYQSADANMAPKKPNMNKIVTSNKNISDNIKKVSYDKKLTFEEDKDYGYGEKTKHLYPFTDGVWQLDNKGKDIMYSTAIVDSTIKFFADKGEIKHLKIGEIKSSDFGFYVLTSQDGKLTTLSVAPENDTMAVKDAKAI